MITNFAAGTLVVLGAVIAVVGFLAGGGVQLLVLGLAAVAVGGVLGMLGRRASS
jgi:hypothetical protein